MKYTKTFIKKTLKAISADVEEVLNKNELANEMNALIDFGEWSGSAPNFSKLIEKWKLTRGILLTYVSYAESFAKTWFEKYPKEAKSKLNYEQIGSFEYKNPWYIIYQNLNCIFMAGELQE